ncbi:hypothetical protein [Allorhizocola rhizosphaerae]|uniref:hypothetical protein n=1 Tax=Allorhizocola rhizosphaerae TaxID=1872709 RepID=UPI000E3CD688|nr:hypothetical protein [Allorhizocola rhizosphaerae]
MVTELDDRLRTILRDDDFAMMGWEDPVGRVTVGIRRRRRNRTLAVACAVLALAVGVPAAVLWPSASRPAPNRPIPYWDSEIVAAPALARREPRPDATPCQAAHLGNHWVQGQTLYVANLGDKRCTLSAPATLDNGVVAGGRFPGDEKQYPATIDPGEPARMDLVFTECDRETSVVVLGVSLSLGNRCVTAASAWYVEPPLLNAPLTVSMEAPATVQRGQHFDYVVTVLNAMPYTFGLDVCPTYLQQLGEDAKWRRLNCAGLTEIPAHTSVKFAMRAYVPDSQPIGAKLRLHWMAVMSDGTVAIAQPATAGVTVEVV